LAVALPAGEHDPAAPGNLGLPRVAQHLVAADLDAGREQRQAVLRSEVDEDARAGVVDDAVARDVDVQRRLPAVAGADVEPGAAST
jgi:hypothetical protein